MAITAKKGEGFERELIPAGNYIARCYKMIEIGTIPNEYMGETKMLHKVRIGWELPTELKVFKEENGEQPLVIEKEYTLSLADKANLRADLQSWRGKAFTAEEIEAFDITKLIGAPCMLNIIHVQGKKDATKTYQQIAGITPMPKGIFCPDAINPPFVFDFEKFDSEKFESLPEFIRKQILESEEYKALTSPFADAEHGVGDSEQDIDPLPF
jgi:hypothetical protein